MFKINISEKSGKTFHLEAEAEELIEKSLNDKIQGKDISPDLEGYELKITGTSDNSGFTSMENVEGIGLKKILLTYGKAMKKRPRKEGKKKLSNKKPKGLRLRKTVRGKIISPAITQINLQVLKEGEKKLAEVFPEQCKTKVDTLKSIPNQVGLNNLKVTREGHDASEKPIEAQAEIKKEEVKETPKTEEKPKDAESMQGTKSPTSPQNESATKEEGLEEKEKKEEKELAQPDKEPTQEKPVEKASEKDKSLTQSNSEPSGEAK